MNIENKLHEELVAEFEELSGMEVGSDQYKTTVDGIAKLMDKAIEMERLDQEDKDKTETRDREYELKLKQMAEDRKDRLVKNGLTAASIFGGFVLTVWGALKSWKFEETGTVTSSAGRKFINNLFFKK